MNRDKLLTALELLKKNGVLCYVYRESVFELLSMNRADGVVHLLSDTPAEDLKPILVKCGFKDAANGKEGNISAPGCLAKQWRFFVLAIWSRKDLTNVYGET